MSRKATKFEPKQCNSPPVAAGPVILAVETSGRLGSIAIAKGGRLLVERSFSGPLKHSAEIFPCIEELLSQLQLPGVIEHIYFDVGPGSFTGIRIAVTIAKMLSLANDVKIVPVDTLDSIAENVADFIMETQSKIEHFAVILDAKRGRFFISAYQYNSGKIRKCVEDQIMTVEQFHEYSCKQPTPVWLLGEGLFYYKERFRSNHTRFIAPEYWNPRACKVHFLGWQHARAGKFADPLRLVPEYLRLPQAEETSFRFRNAD